MNQVRNHNFFLTFPVILIFLFISCDDESENIEFIKDDQQRYEDSQKSTWSTIFFDPFNNLNSWTKTDRADYNSPTCFYRPSNVSIVNINGTNNALKLEARKTGSNSFQSGHVKSLRQFKPENNQEIRFRGRIKLQSKNRNGNTLAFHKTYGAWPAFWTVEENGWPSKGEIDIMEAYTYGGANNDRYACNMFYGRNIGRSDLNHGQTVQSYTQKIRPISWNIYEMRWRNKNGNITVSVYINGEFVKRYTNRLINNLRLENFTPHNIILNLNVGDNLGIFDNSRVNLFNRTEMMIDWVRVEKRSLQ